jgi:hypothetical protein
MKRKRKVDIGDVNLLLDLLNGKRLYPHLNIELDFKRYTDKAVEQLIDITHRYISYDPTLTVWKPDYVSWDTVRELHLLAVTELRDRKIEMLLV